MLSQPRWFTVAGVATLFALTATTSFGAVTLNGMFTDNLVLQHGMEVPIWGAAAPGEQVTVSACGQVSSAVAGDDGRWMVRLDPIAVTEPFDVTVSGENEIVLHNALMGDVWICSGQSNMALPLDDRIANAAEERASANYPMIRLCQINRTAKPQPTDEITARWFACTPEVVRGFSALAYFFGREIHQETGVPIGLVSSNVGGSTIEAWISDEKLRQYPATTGSIFERWRQTFDLYPAAMEKYLNETIPAWEQQVATAQAAGQTPPRKPYPPLGPDDYSMQASQRPSIWFNAMIYPLIPYGIKGAIWYQGEGNVGSGFDYRVLLPALIEDWRTRWGQGDFPYGWVQLPNYNYVQQDPNRPAGWAEVREAQTMALRVPNTGQAVTYDTGDPENIHPPNKQTPAHRLALWALATVYGRNVPCLGPTYVSMTVEGNRIRLRFVGIDDGLVTGTNPNAPEGDTLRGFQVAGADRVWHWAEAQLDQDTVLVWSDEVAEPVAARYAWADNPVANLYNAEGLPAVPFRTDDWPITSQQPGQ